MPPPAVDLTHTVAFLLAGGQGTRMHELTQNECKPALHFGGMHRIVDFSVANVVTSGIGRMLVATQYQPGTLTRHLNAVWLPAFPDAGLVLRDGRHVAGRHGYRGTADALRANIAALDALGAREIVVLAADHVYRMDYAPLVAHHRALGSKVTVAALPLALTEAQGMGSVTVGAAGTLAGYEDAAVDPRPLPDDPARAMASLGVYVISWRWMRSLLMRQAGMSDVARDVLPFAVREGVAGLHVWKHGADRSPYWRRVSTLDAYRLASLDFAGPDTPSPRPVVPGLASRIPPDVSVLRSRFGAELNTGGIRILSPLLRASDPSRWAMLDRSVLLPGARVSPGVRLTNCLVAPGTALPDGLVVGEDREEDARWFRVTPDGTTLITSAMLARRAARRAASVLSFLKGASQALRLPG